MAASLHERRVKAHEAEMARESADVRDEMQAASMDWNLLSEWIGAIGWRSYHLHDVKAMQAAHGSDAQILAIADMTAELVEAFMADDNNWIAAQRRVVAMHAADAAEARAA